MMAKPKAKKRPPPDEDEAQSRRFLEAANAAEADGGLSPIDAEKVFERAIGKIMPPKRQSTPG